MIGYLRGIVKFVQGSCVTLQANQVGYEVNVPESAIRGLPSDDREAEFYIHMDVQERSHELFGFTHLAERDAFRILISVSGIGPRTALGILSEMSASDLVTAVQLDDHHSLQRVPKIGRKTAERLLIELRDKIDHIAVEYGPEEDVADASVEMVREATAALIELGFGLRDSRRASAIAAKSAENTEQAIRMALASLSAGN